MRHARVLLKVQDRPVRLGTVRRSCLGAELWTRCATTMASTAVLERELVEYLVHVSAAAPQHRAAESSASPLCGTSVNLSRCFPAVTERAEWPAGVRGSRRQGGAPGRLHPQRSPP